MKRIKLKPDKQGHAYVEHGVVYAVLDETPEGYWIRNERATFLVSKQHFDVVTEPVKRVRCICNRWGYGNALTVGKVYGVIYESYLDYTLLSNNSKLIKASKYKFENVQEEENVSRENVTSAASDHGLSDDFEWTDKRTFGCSYSDYCKVGWTIDLLLSEGIIVKKKQIKFNQQEEVKMSNNQVQLVNIKLFDDDQGLKPEDRIVSFHANFATVSSNEKTICNALLKLDIAGDIEKHNQKRAKTVDLTVLKNTGNKVFLQPIEFDDLRIEVTRL